MNQCEVFELKHATQLLVRSRDSKTGFTQTAQK